MVAIAVRNTIVERVLGAALDFSTRKVWNLQSGFSTIGFVLRFLFLIWAIRFQTMDQCFLFPYSIWCHITIMGPSFFIWLGLFDIDQRHSLCVELLIRWGIVSERLKTSIPANLELYVIVGFIALFQITLLITMHETWKVIF